MPVIHLYLLTSDATLLDSTHGLRAYCGLVTGAVLQHLWDEYCEAEVTNQKDFILD